jgi:alkylation response protein AidB-like acyl-CoA dehydrogenase
MYFGFTTDQLALRDGVREALRPRDETGPPAVGVGGGETGNGAEVWKHLAGVGLLAALVPEADGGLGLDELDVLLCLEESGRAAVPVPLVETAVVAARLLAGTEHASRLAAGAWRVTAALDGSGLAPWADAADAVLTGGPEGVVRLLEPVTGDLVDLVENVAAVDPQRPLARVPSGAGTVVCDDAATAAAAVRAGALGTAAQLVGLADAALRTTVGYVAERRQFGVPVGSFQAVQHQLADAAVALELARPLVYAAGWSHARGEPSADRDVAAAKIRAGAAANQVARAALQCHGGIGYTREYPLHRWLLRIWALHAAWGPEGRHRALLAASLGLTD